MNTIKTSLFILGILLFASGQALAVPTIWESNYITFTKVDDADWTLAVNQDRITDNVWITRGYDRPIFNIANESGASSSNKNDVPTDTEWAFLGLDGNPSDSTAMTASNYASLNFDTFRYALDEEIGYNMLAMGVLHLITDDIYLNIEFLSWTEDDDGGGFSYRRASAPASTVPEPGTLVLLGSGLLGLIGFRKKFN